MSAPAASSGTIRQIKMALFRFRGMRHGVSGNLTTFEGMYGWVCIGLMVMMLVKAIYMYHH